MCMYTCLYVYCVYLCGDTSRIMCCFVCMSMYVYAYVYMLVCVLCSWCVETRLRRIMCFWMSVRVCICIHACMCIVCMVCGDTFEENNVLFVCICICTPTCLYACVYVSVQVSVYVCPYKSWFKYIPMLCYISKYPCYVIWANLMLCYTSEYQCYIIWANLMLCYTSEYQCDLILANTHVMLYEWI
jgi:GINS complex subunit 2